MYIHCTTSGLHLVSLAASTDLGATFLSPNPGYPARPPPCSLDPLRRRFLSPYCCFFASILDIQICTIIGPLHSLVLLSCLRPLSAPACRLSSWVRPHLSFSLLVLSLLAAVDHRRRRVLVALPLSDLLVAISCIASISRLSLPSVAKKKKKQKKKAFILRHPCEDTLVAGVR